MQRCERTTFSNMGPIPSFKSALINAGIQLHRTGRLALSQRFGIPTYIKRDKVAVNAVWVDYIKEWFTSLNVRGPVKWKGTCGMSVDGQGTNGLYEERDFRVEGFS